MGPLVDVPVVIGLDNLALFCLKKVLDLLDSPSV